MREVKPITNKAESHKDSGVKVQDTPKEVAHTTIVEAKNPHKEEKADQTVNPMKENKNQLFIVEGFHTMEESQVGRNGLISSK